MGKTVDLNFLVYSTVNTGYFIVSTGYCTVSTRYCTVSTGYCTVSTGLYVIQISRVRLTLAFLGHYKFLTYLYFNAKGTLLLKSLEMTSLFCCMVQHIVNTKSHYFKCIFGTLLLICNFLSTKNYI